VDGRMNTYKLFTGAVAIIDFAHTPDGLEKVLKSLKQINKDKKIVTIFGCGGNRDFLKRPIMGKIACSLSDYVFITSDNPRSENPNDIVKDITTQLKCTNYEIVIDRKLAIKKAIENFKYNSIILIAGKGAERYQEINGVKIKYSDEDEIKKYIL
ncbi:MAG: UDP-N-acetylmuramoyl-L-alanyl-D-glutamate--2,6-diaminopimelate ligase, partial [Clostridia bacterium]|nr:UDP-N-acetylmuramoyl-L-alanyl-D-glutamate--2,6-diaminopimelate ligase [Clostridia bacterium]